MSRSLRARGLRLLLLSLALLPSGIYAWLGTFSRMHNDEFWFLKPALEHGPWTNMLYWRERWNGAYADWFAHGLLAPLREWAPAILPSITIVVWLLGLTWLLAQCLEQFKAREGRWLWSLAAAGLLVAGAINALFAPGPFFWLSASLRLCLSARAPLPEPGADCGQWAGAFAQCRLCYWRVWRADWQILSSRASPSRIFCSRFAACFCFCSS